MVKKCLLLLLVLGSQFSIMSGCARPNDKDSAREIIEDLIDEIESNTLKGEARSLKSAVIAVNLYKLSAYKFKHIKWKIDSETLKTVLSDKSGKSLIDFILYKLAPLLTSNNVDIRIQSEHLVLDIMREKLLNNEIRELRSDDKFIDSLISLAYFYITSAYQERFREKMPDYWVRAVLKEAASIAYNKQIQNFFVNLSENPADYEKLKTDIFLDCKQLFDEGVLFKGLAIKNIGISISEQVMLYFKAILCYLCIVEIHRNQPEFTTRAQDELNTSFLILKELNRKKGN
ncbi:MAG: hypothetical protein HY606_10880 [Planctomycetes bacterium]|nr:hypothetical protein [Planctomycetota bacterium]